MARRTGRPRGEVAEITTALDRLSTLNGSKMDVVLLKRECFQKLIRYMTQGIDMSAVFVSATKCAALSRADVPLKKMLYLYLRSTARANAETALLVVQTLVNDCGDTDATIRGAALRSLASLRVADVEDAALAAVERGLGDRSAYVREAAVLGVLKCWVAEGTEAADAVASKGLLDRVATLLTSDPDPQVVANCLHVLLATGELSRRGWPDRALVVSLLNHVRAFSEWAQCAVLDVVAGYEPASEPERLDILEVCDYSLSASNTAVLLAGLRLFLRHTAGDARRRSRVLRRLRDPIATVSSGREPEVAFAFLSNVLVLADKYPEAFSDLHESFYVAPADPSYLRRVKVRLLCAVACDSNAHAIAEELTAYVRDVDELLARRAVSALGTVAVRAPGAPGVPDRLLSLLEDAERPAVLGDALAALAAVLRAYPAAAEVCAPIAAARVDPASLDEPEARAAYARLLGEHAAIVPGSPYLLEALAEGLAAEDALVQQAVLAASARAFLSRPGEALPALRLALAATLDSPNPTVSDRAKLYLNLLRSGSAPARAALSATPPASDPSAPPAELADRLLDEIDTLAPLYGAPLAAFVDPAAAPLSVAAGAGAFAPGDDLALPGGPADATDDDASADVGIQLLADEEPATREHSGAGLAGLAASPAGPADAPPSSAPSSAADLLADLGISGPPPAGAPADPFAPQPAAAAPTPPLAGDPMDFFGPGFGAVPPAPTHPAAKPANPPASGFDDLLGGL